MAVNSSRKSTQGGPSTTSIRWLPSCRPPVKLILCLGSLILSSSCTSTAAQIDLIDGNNVMRHVEQLIGFGPHPPGSDAQRKVGDYLVEGHVPADLIKRFLEEETGVAGITVPGMVMGPPGMEGPRPVPYDVLTFGRDGSSTIYESR